MISPVHEGMPEMPRWRRALFDLVSRCTNLCAAVLNHSTMTTSSALYTTLHYVFISIVALHSFRLKLCSVKCMAQCSIHSAVDLYEPSSVCTVNSVYQCSFCHHHLQFQIDYEQCEVINVQHAV